MAKYYEPGIQDVIDIPQAKLLLESCGGIGGVIAALKLASDDQ
ncbi:MAG: hypothetical protein Q8P72_05835 [Candidatus Roizmanbacteria bacterium]|nr:hypothetical protein [Candidatus Roizmanbacteria bacterium]